MPKSANFPKPPADLGPCKDCRWWLASVAVMAVKLPTGVVVPADQYRAGGLLIGDAIEFSQAPCTLMPQWIMQPDMGWCGQWNACLPLRPARFDALAHERELQEIGNLVEIKCPICGMRPPGRGSQCLGSDRTACPY